MKYALLALALGLCICLFSCGDPSSFVDQTESSQSPLAGGVGGEDSNETPSNNYNKNGADAQVPTSDSNNEADDNNVDAMFDADGNLKNEVTFDDAGAILDLCKGDKVQKQSFPLNFPRREDCSFGVGENLTILDGSIRAFEKTTRSIQRPGLVCDIDIASAQFDFHYDDFMFLAINNNIIASGSNSMVRTFDQTNDLYQWDWQKLVNFDMGDDDKTPYCFSADMCNIPSHDKKGEVNISFVEDDFASLAMALFKGGDLNFDLIATGDNDGGDCFHEKVDLMVDVFYIPQN